MKRWAVLVVISVVFGVGASCVETCIPGKTGPCACTDGRSGAQICRANGTFEPCVCTAPLDAGVADGAVDACLENRNAPAILNSSNGVSTWRLASGQTIRLDPEVQDFDRDPLTYAWSVHAEDAGSLGPDAGLVITGPGAARITVSELGRWVVELRVSDGCNESSQSWPIEVLPARKLPFMVSDVVCCDLEGRAFAIAPLTAQVMRLDMDGGVDATQSLPRVPRSLSLDAQGQRLVVAQDAYVSFFRLEGFTREAEWPVTFAVEAAIANGDTAWLYGGSLQGVILSIDAGTLRAQSSSAERVERGFVSADGGWLVVSASNQLTSLSVGSALMRTNNDWGSTCSSLWAVSARSRFITGCGEAWVPAADGGLAYAGRLREQTTFEALTETSDGTLVASYLLAFNQARLRFMNASSLGVQADFEIGLQSSDLSKVLAPSFLLPGAQGRVHALTPDPLNDVTWWEEY